MKIKHIRTNEKAEGFRAVDLPAFDVLVDGTVIGQVYARLVRSHRHHTAGYVKIWAAKYNGRHVGDWTTKADATANLLKKLEA